MSQLVPSLIQTAYVDGRRQGEFEAIALFVDISGFTGATDTLMQHGNAGAEALAKTLAEVFSPIVDAVEAMGGIITGFEGDAVLALFPLSVANAPWQAVQAAWFIRERIGQGQQFATPFGEFRFSAKLGMGVGRAQWFIFARGPQATYLFQGTAIHQATTAEARAQSGELLVNRDLLPYFIGLAEMSGTPRGYLIEGLKQPIQAFPPILRRTDRVVGPFLPESLLTLNVRGEFRKVVSLFLNIPGGADEEDVAKFIDLIFTLQSRYGGLINHLNYGDKEVTLLIMWGAPQSFENDLERAVNFALDLVEDAPATFRGGMTESTAYAGFVGGKLREEYTCYSSRVNLAARLMMAAQWGEIWIDEQTRRRLPNRIEARDTGMMPFKGFSDPQATFALVGRSVRVRQSFFRQAMVGRQTEMGRLINWYDAALNGRFAGVMTIYGEAGMGKSRLTSAFTAHTLRLRSDALVLLGQTDQLVHQSFNPIRYALRSYFQQDATNDELIRKMQFEVAFRSLMIGLRAVLPPDTADELGNSLLTDLERAKSFLGALVDLSWEGSLYAQAEPRLRYQQTLQAIKTLILAESLRRPVIVYLEDVHWLDDDSRALLSLLCQDVEHYGFGILLTSRYQDDGTRSPALPKVPELALDLTELTIDEVEHFTQAILDGPLTTEFAAFLTEKTGGNPFFVEQLALDMRERGALQCHNGVWDLNLSGQNDLPANINAVLVARIDRLSADVRNVVQAAAVLGREFEVQVLTHMLSNDSSVHQKVEVATRETIWTTMSELRYLFRHALLRDAAYDMQLHSRQRELHALALHSLETIFAADPSPHLADLVYHANRAELAERELHYTRLAGERTLMSSSFRDSIAYFQRAVVLSPPADPQRCVLLIRLGEASALFGDFGGAKQHLRDGLDQARLLGDRPHEVQALCELSRITMVADGDWAGALNLLNEALQIAREIDNAGLIALALQQLGNYGIFSGKYDDARLYLEESVIFARQSGEQVRLGMASNSLSHVYAEKGMYDEALALAYQVRDIANEIGNRRLLMFGIAHIGLVALRRHNGVEALERFSECLRLSLSMGDQEKIATVANYVGECYIELGYWSDALRVYQQALRVGLQSKVWPEVTRSVVAYARFCLHLNDPLQAAELITVAVEHKTANWETRHTGHPVRDYLAQTLAPTDWLAAQERGRTRTLEATGQELLTFVPFTPTEA